METEQKIIIARYDYIQSRLDELEGLDEPTKEDYSEWDMLLEEEQIVMRRAEQLGIDRWYLEAV